MVKTDRRTDRQDDRIKHSCGILYKRMKFFDPKFLFFLPRIIMGEKLKYICLVQFCSQFSIQHSAKRSRGLTAWFSVLLCTIHVFIYTSIPFNIEEWGFTFTIIVIANWPPLFFFGFGHDSTRRKGKK